MNLNKPFIVLAFVLLHLLICLSRIFSALLGKLLFLNPLQKAIYHLINHLLENSRDKLWFVHKDCFDFTLVFASRFFDMTLTKSSHMKVTGL